MRNLLSLTALILFSACDTQSHEKILAINGFEWTNKKIIELQPELNEISGIAYDKKNNNFLAVNDEQGILFVLNPSNFSIQKKLKFGKKGDYECVAVDGEKVFVLKSNGDVYTMVYNMDIITQSDVSLYSGTTAEFEAGLWDNEQKRLRLISKKSAVDKENQANSIYRFNPIDANYSLDNTSKIEWDELRNKNVVIKAFHPSGAAVQPLTGNLFVVSSIEKLLVIFSATWDVISVHPLDEKIFKQPEGITFDNEGNLLITNEAADAKPTIIFIPIKK